MHAQRPALLLCFLLLAAHGDIRATAPLNPRLLDSHWPAHWVTHPEAPARDFGVFHFRRNFELGEKPGKFLIHVSADNRYRLFVNGQAVSQGPSRGDILRWRFETVDIAPHLKQGKNALAAVVWNFGEFMPLAQITLRTAFLLQGDSDRERLVDTGSEWRVYQNQAFSPLEDYRAILNTYIVVGPGERIDGSRYPWGWEQPGFDDSSWKPVRILDNGIPRGVGTDGAWFLVPPDIPPMEERLERIPRVRRSSGIEAGGFVFDGKKALEIPPRTKARLLLDAGQLTTAYPEVLVSGGRGSEVKLTYSEALFDRQMRKGHRDEIENREVRGIWDVFLPDGGAQRLFRPLWFRTYRYVDLQIVTGDAPLTIHDLYGQFTAYPFEERAVFSSNDSSLEKIWDVGWRTARLCSNETYYDCPYYEQIQYVGDTRIQALISLYVSGDDRLARKAILTFDDSRIPEGLTQSRYPCSSPQVIPPYSLFWIAMIHDYWMHRDDPAFVESFFPGIQSVLDWHRRHVHPSGMLGASRWWNFVDWPDEWAWNDVARMGGVPSLDDFGRSSILSLQYVLVLQLAADLAEAFERGELAAKYRKQAERVSQATLRLCWDDRRGMLADTPDKQVFSQHANSLAVLTGLIPEAQRQGLMRKILGDRSLIQCTMYYRFYLFRAMKAAGLGNEYIDTLDPWHEMLKIGLTTFAERPEPTRSDCHAWSSSPNYELLATVCGIEPGSPGFKTVRIEPFMGPLREVSGKVPHPLGDIQVRFEGDGGGALKGEVILPAGLTGELLWNGRALPLTGGRQKVEVN
jgi:alpha-L-rhamnosidase